MDSFKRMMGFLNVFEEVDSLSFKEYTNQIIAGFKFDGYIMPLTKYSFIRFYLVKIFI